MRRRQTLPGQWLVADERLGDELWMAARALPLGSGILVLRRLDSKERRRLRHLAMLRGLRVERERPGRAARVHDVRELRQALLGRTPLILLSPIHPTRSHPDRRPLPRMRAAALARLARRRLVALGGMDARRYAKIARLGFSGWAGIDAYVH
jgi:thiamine-phosphate pyrophosphorylase